MARRHCVAGVPVDTYRWRDAILSERGPRSGTARLVLLVIAQHMHADGTGAWPSQELIAKRTGLSDRVVRKHVEVAMQSGWLERRRVRRDRGRNWYFHAYGAAVPPSVYSQLRERPWETDPTWRRPEHYSGTQVDDRNDVPPVNVTTGTATHDDRNETMRRPERGSADDRNVVPTNSPSELSIELSQRMSADADRAIENSKAENQTGKTAPAASVAGPLTAAAARSLARRTTANGSADPDLPRRIVAFTKANPAAEFAEIARLLHTDVGTVRRALSAEAAT